MNDKPNGITSAETWRAASQASRAERAERLQLPSGAFILAARPEPIEWILAGRLPHKLLSAAMENASEGSDGAHTMTREEILELAQFAEQMVKAAVVEPCIGNGPGEIAVEDIPIQDRAFIFEWACRAWNSDLPGEDNSSQEGRSIPLHGIERFRSK